MPKRTDIESVLIIGAGPIIIGQACEFDYSGTQACKALREENIRIILVNPNPATIMTDPDMANATYIEPIDWRIIEKIIDKERPDAILPTMGGQTALNCALNLNRRGILQTYNVELIGASVEAIEKAEDRQLFKEEMSAIGLATTTSLIARNIEEAERAQQELGYPTIIRPSFTLGGSGGGIAYNHEEFLDICAHGLAISPTSEILLECSLLGWKEFEMEVVRDTNDNCIIVCSIENLDPMGVHTGDSITVAPAQTLTDKEYQIMRNASLAILRAIGVETGGANVQFAVDPDTGKLIVIEMNPRVSRSSALASKATGFPIAKVATKLAIGYTLDELSNELTGGIIPISFEPVIDYVVTKIPRFTFEKFPQADVRLTTQMKSVGEVMAIGRTFQESLQKALRSLETNMDGLNAPESSDEEGDAEDALQRIKEEMRTPTANRLFFVADALRRGMAVDEVYKCCKIDVWFLLQIKDIVDAERHLTQHGWATLDKHRLRTLKRKGFSDSRLATLLSVTEQQVREHRHHLGIRPVFKRIDSCSAEFSATTAYMYSTYEDECEANPSAQKKIMVLGGGPNRIGQGIEFDYCCVQALLAIRAANYQTIMVNCNPETVSTDYDVSDRLYFEPLTLEDILEIIEVEKPDGVIVQYGGQTPLKLAAALEASGALIIGTSPDSIDLAENRQRFQQLLVRLDLKQPPNCSARGLEEAVSVAKEVGYPLIIRPSYVLGGRAMQIAYDEADLRTYMYNVESSIGYESPVLLDKFLNNAIEVDVDAVCDGEKVLLGGIMQHIEMAGVHSGDSACTLPPYSLSADIQSDIRQQVCAMAKEINVIGLMNVQFAIQGDDIYVLEVNPRASRTVPFVSKATGVALAQIATNCMIGQKLSSQQFRKIDKMHYFAVKESVFPFIKFSGVDPLLGPEMKSTGEVMGISKTFPEAFAKAQLAAGEIVPDSGLAFISVRDEDKQEAVIIAKELIQIGFKLCATQGTANAIRQLGIACQTINKVREGQPHIVDALKNNQIDMIINTTKGKQAVADSYSIRRSALQYNVFYTTTMAAAMATIEALKQNTMFHINCLQDLYKGNVGGR